MIPCLISLEDLTEVMKKQKYKYFIQIESDGSFKVHIKIDKFSEEKSCIENRIMSMITEKILKERKKKK